MRQPCAPKAAVLSLSRLHSSTLATCARCYLAGSVMDGGAFYGRTNITANSSVGLSRHFTSPPSTSWFTHIDGSTKYAPTTAAVDAVFGQKLDRVLILLQNQCKEIDCIMEENTAVLSSDVEVLKQQ